MTSRYILWLFFGDHCSYHHVNQPLRSTQVIGMHLFGQFVKNRGIFVPVRVKMAIYDEPLHFMVIFWGQMLIPASKLILEEYPGHWDALIRPKCGNGSYFNPPLCLKMAILGIIMAQIWWKWPNLDFSDIYPWELNKCDVTCIEGSGLLDYWPNSDILVHVMVKIANLGFQRPFMMRHCNLGFFWGGGQCSIHHGN